MQVMTHYQNGERMFTDPQTSRSREREMELVSVFYISLSHQLVDTA